MRLCAFRKSFLKEEIVVISVATNQRSNKVVIKTVLLDTIAFQHFVNLTFRH